MNKNENSFRGLFYMNSYSTQHQHLFVFSNDKTLIATYKVTGSKISKKLFSFKIYNSKQLSMVDQIDKV
ncbi:hypothetical protein ACM6Q7_12425 [Peribacillus butanolivorans]